MKKGIVRTILEERLASYGFAYVKYEDFRWLFRKETEDGWQQIVIQKDIWGGKSYRLEMNSSIHPGALRLSDLSDESRHRAGFLEYRDEEEQKAVLNEMCDVAIECGFEKISKGTSPAKRYIITLEMKMKLYNENEQMTQRFLERNHLQTLSMQEVFPVLEKELEETFEKIYEQIADKLMEIAAVYGNMMLNIIGGSWSRNGIERQPFCIGFPILAIVVDAWKKDEKEMLFVIFEDMIYTYKKWFRDCIIANGGRMPKLDDWSEEDIIRVLKEPLERVQLT